MYIINDYQPLTVPKRLEFVPVMDGDKHATDFDGQKKYTVVINGEPVKCIRQYRDSCGWPPDNYVIPENRREALIDGFKAMNHDFPFEVENFNYNGFMGGSEEGMAPYRAKFVRWSGDPGIAVMLCSDGKERFIPTFAICGAYLALPEDNTAFEDKLMFGSPSRS